MTKIVDSGILMSSWTDARIDPQVPKLLDDLSARIASACDIPVTVLMGGEVSQLRDDDRADRIYRRSIRRMQRAFENRVSRPDLSPHEDGLDGATLARCGCQDCKETRAGEMRHRVAFRRSVRETVRSAMGLDR